MIQWVSVTADRHLCNYFYMEIVFVQFVKTFVQRFVRKSDIVSFYIFH